jgi:ribosomal-protein-serine acetyltransferase
MEEKFRIIVDKDTILKPLSQTDIAIVFDAVSYNRRYLRQWLPWVDYTNHETDTRSFIEKTEAGFASGSSIILSIWHKEQFVGVISLDQISQQHKKATIGYWLVQEYQSLGLMTRSCEALLKYAFKALNLNRIEILCSADNSKSRAIPERLNFTNEGILRSYMKINDEFSDVIVYSKLKEELV